MKIKSSYAFSVSFAVLAAISAYAGGAAFAPRFAQAASAADTPTATPIKHLVVIYGENVSFDHYFGTYPKSANPPGQPTQAWVAPSNVAAPNNYIRTPSLLTSNPNASNAKNLSILSAAYLNPFRIDRAQFDTADQDHDYSYEQRAANNLKMDAFPYYVGYGTSGGAGQFGTDGQVMGYFDGNTVTALWNYAQNYAMSDNMFTDTFGPSTLGAINLIAGNTNGVTNSTADTVSDGQGNYTVIGDPDPLKDKCGSSGTTYSLQMKSKNIGDLLNAAGVPWGAFMGGFDLTAVNANKSTGCSRSTISPSTGRTQYDYVVHHAWFQYFPSTANINHTRPSSVAKIGYTEVNDTPNGASAVNHQYDYNDFIAALNAGNFPAVSYIKAPGAFDGHPGNSNPLDEQRFVTGLMNTLMQNPEWKSTAVIITYDDTDGWYDHQAPNILRSSKSTKDFLSGTSSCTGPNAAPALNDAGNPVNGRCGPGMRVPFLLVSPYAKTNYVDSTPIMQSSVIRFIEDNWLSGKRLGGGSNDAIAGSIMNMFDFTAAPKTTPLLLCPSNGTKALSSNTAC